MIKTKTTIVLGLFMHVSSLSFGQSFPKNKMMQKLKAWQIKMDEGNGDGVFRAQSRKTKKWGMYQWMGGSKVKEMVPMQYDRLRNFPFNGHFTAVYNNGKVGIYLCEWSYGEKARQTVECKYEDYRRINARTDKYSAPTTYLAMKKDGKWGYVNWLTGEEMSEFIYDTSKDMPFPHFEQAYYE